MLRRRPPSGGARAVRSGSPKRRAEFVAPAARVAPADDVVVRPAVHGDDFSVADEKHHRIGAVVDAARVLVVDPHTDSPAVSERTQRRLLLEELLGSRLELDDRAAGIEELGPEVVPDEFLVVFRARAVVVGGHLRLSRRALAAAGQGGRRAASSCATVTLESPRCRILPARWASASAPTESAKGTCGSGA